MAVYTVDAIRKMAREEIKRIRSQAMKGARIYDHGFTLNVAAGGASLLVEYRTSADECAMLHGINIAL